MTTAEGERRRLRAARASAKAPTKGERAQPRDPGQDVPGARASSGDHRGPCSGPPRSCVPDHRDRATFTGGLLFCCPRRPLPAPPHAGDPKPNLSFSSSDSSKPRVKPGAVPSGRRSFPGSASLPAAPQVRCSVQPAARPGLSPARPLTHAHPHGQLPGRHETLEDRLSSTDSYGVSSCVGFCSRQSERLALSPPHR